jgi:hypothetical protein
VGWEARKRGTGSYYYRSVREGDRVKKEYCGGGVLGEIVALDDELRRLQKAEKLAFWKEEKERLEANAAFLKELEKAAEILIRAHLIAAGCHKHKGE